MNPSTSFIAMALTAATLAAQGTTYVAYPQDTTTGGWTNTIPLGYAPDPMGTEGRVQMLIPRGFLPSSGGLILGIEVIAGVSRSVTYSSLQVSLDHLVSPTPFPVLQNTFAANLTAPVPVLALTNQTINYPGGQWFGLTFQQPFAYNGSDHLLLDFVKYVPPPVVSGLGMKTSRDERVDTPWAVGSSGQLGSGAAGFAMGQPSTRPLRMRIVFAGATPTTVASSPMVGAVYWGIGTSVGLDTQAAPGALAWQWLDLSIGGLGSRATPLSVPPLAGAAWLAAPGSLLLLHQVLVVAPNGVATGSLQLPADPALQGLMLVFQSLVFDPVNGWSWASATDCTIG